MRLAVRARLVALASVGITAVLFGLFLLSYERERRIESQIGIVRTLRTDAVQLQGALFDYVLYREARPRLQARTTLDKLQQRLQDPAPPIAAAHDESVTIAWEEVRRLVEECEAHFVSLTNETDGPAFRERQRRTVDLLLLKGRALVFALDRLARLLSGELQLTRRQAEQAFIMLLAGLAGLGISLSVFLSRSILDPLKQLHEAAIQVAAGQRDFRLRSFRRDEFGQLAEAFDNMLDQIEETTVSRDRLEAEIAERRRMELKLVRSEYELREAQRIGGIGSWYWNPQTDLDDGQSSKELLRIFGLDPDQSLPAFHDQKGRLYSVESWEQVNAAVEETMRTGMVYHLDIEARRADGTPIWITTRGEVIRDADGQIIGMRGTVQDITARRRTETKLEEASRLLDTLLEYVPEGITVADAPDGRIRRVSRYGQTLLGSPHEGVTAQKVAAQWTVYYPDGVTRMTEDELPLMRALRRGEELWDVELIQMNAAGQRLNLSCNAAPIRDSKGGIVGAIVAWRDITERKRIEATLRESEATLQAAQHLAGIGNWKWDLRTNAHSWSDEIYRLYGRNPALPPAIYPEVQQYFTPESWTRLAAAVEQAMTASVPYECDAEVVRPDGSRRWIVARGEATRDAAGTVVELHGTVQDITERKQAESEIYRLNAELEERVLQRTSELAAANHELDSFAYAVSHDLRAPLRAMSGFSQALLEDYGETLNGEAQSYLNNIILASHRMGDLIDGLLKLSRSTRGGLRQEPVDLTALVERLLAEQAATEPERRVHWTVEPELRVQGDPAMLEVVMRNLLENAWKYTAKAPNATIRVYTEYRDNKRWFCVADNGAGFDMNHANRLFQAFQRLHRQDEFPGIGIGLATVQRIIHRHGGVIGAEGAPGCGATFRFTLPYAETLREEVV